jgi:rhombotail lipoprotein
LPAGLAGLFLVGLLASGCAGFFGVSRSTERSSSIVGYLYPDQKDPLPPTTIPVLRLPLRVGIAFVPPVASGGYYGQPRISEMQKNALMQRVADEFKGRDYIQSIELIPATYLRATGGFENLDQVRQLLNLDVVALVAYDQVQFTNENVLSLAYWTIVGAYIFHGNKNDTQTLVEAAVYDIPSRHLLFHAPGASQVQAGTAAMYVEQNLRADSAKGLDLAMADLTKNLKTELEAFRERLKHSPGEVQIEHKAGYSGGGEFGGGFVLALALLFLGRGQMRRGRK